MTTFAPSPFKYSSRWGYIRIAAHVPNALGSEGCTMDGKQWRMISEVMRRIFVVEARPTYNTDDITYLCISPLFEELAEGEEPPEYDAILANTRADDGTEKIEFLRFQRVDIKVHRTVRW